MIGDMVDPVWMFQLMIPLSAVVAAVEVLGSLTFPVEIDLTDV